MILQAPPAGYEQKKAKYGPYSPSRLITANCPQRFYAQYIRKDRVVGATLAAARGSSIHEVLEKITLARQEKQLLTQKQVSDWVSQAVGKFPAAYPQIDLVQKAADAYVANPSPYVTDKTSCEASFAIQLWEEPTFFDGDTSNIHFVQVPYEIEKGKTNPDVFFGGRIDQISIDEEVKTITILDHKSTPSSSQNEEHHFQVGAYAWLVSLFYPGYKIRTVIHFCHPTLNFYAPPNEWSEEDLRDTGALVLAKIQALEDMQDFVAIPGSGCDYCHITQECTLFQKVREQKAKGTVDLNVRTFDDLLRLAKELRVVGVMYDEISKALKGGVDTLCPEHGVNIGGMWYGYKASETAVDWDATESKIREESQRAQGRLEAGGVESESDRQKLEKVAKRKGLTDLLEDHGLSAESFKNFNGSKLKNLWRMDKPELFEELSPMIVPDKKTKWGGYKG